MTEAPQRTSFNALREFLLSCFSAGELDDLFAFAETAELRSACDRYLPTDSLPTRVRRAIIHCERHDLLDELLMEIKRARPDLVHSLREQFRGATALVLGLPAYLATFTGRSAQIQEIRDQLSRLGMAVINGTGGIGKTALAVHVAHQLNAEGRFRDAQLYIDLKGADPTPVDTADALASLLNTLAGRDPSRPHGLATLGALWRQAIDGLDAILILDNAVDAEQVHPLLTGCSTCAVLVTSRQCFALPGSASLTLQGMDREEARKLLQLLAPRLEDGEADAIAGLCGDLPLALRVAGNYLNMNNDCPPHRYAWMLVDERARRKRQREPDDHDLDVAAAISLSVARLDANPRRAWFLRRGWALLSLFPAPFELPAAAVLWNELRHEAQVLELLQTLCHHGLVTYDGELGRYYLHDLVRLAAAKALEFLGRQVAEAARQRLADHYGAEVLHRKGYWEGGTGVLQGPTLFDLQWPHIRAGQAWAAALAGQDRVAAWLCKDYVWRTVRCLTQRLHARDYIAWFEAAARAARHLGMQGYEGGHQVNLGDACLAMGEIERAIKHYQQALQIARDDRDRCSEAFRLLLLGNAYRELGERELAVEHYTAALQIARDAGPRPIEAKASWELGRLYEESDPARAVELMLVYVRWLRDFERRLLRFGTPFPEAEACAREVERIRGCLK